MNRAFRILLVLSLPLFLTSCSMALKGGVHRFSDDELQNLRDNPTFQVWELEAGLHEFHDRKVDLTLGVGFVESIPATDFQDFRLTSRYHFPNRTRVLPYVGGGVGWFRLFTRDPFVIPLDCAGAPPGSLEALVCPRIEGENDRTLASGFYPHVVGGMRVGITESIDFVLEDRLDLARRDQGVNFDANQLTVGFRFDWQSAISSPPKPRKSRQD